MDVFALAYKYCVDEITDLCEQRLQGLICDDAEALSNVGERVGPALPALIEFLDHKRARVRASAAAALGLLKQHAAPALPALAERLKGSSRRVAARVLKDLGEHAASELGQPGIPPSPPRGAGAPY